MDLGHKVIESVAHDTPKTAPGVARISNTKIQAAPEGFKWLRSFDLLRSCMDFGHKVSESVAQDTSETVLADARNLIRKIQAAPEGF